ncbi:MAG: hypothetical protein ABI456_25440 [Ktedonobacteraceae bacterium]|nr:hypothetical protein [Chloroflexota bacterium]
MSKLLDMFSRVRRGQSGEGIGFLGRSKPVAKARAAALVVEFTDSDAGAVEAAIKAGADGVLFSWDGKDSATLTTLKPAIEAAKTAKENIATGVRITSGLGRLKHKDLEHLKEQGIHYVILPLTAPARLLGMHIKDLDIVVSIPMREGELYPNFIRNLNAFENVAAIHLDFGLTDEVGAMSIEDIMHYRAVREAVRAGALLNLVGKLDEADAYTLLALGVQGVILGGEQAGATDEKQIKQVRELLEKIHQEEEQDDSTPSLPGKM